MKLNKTLITILLTLHILTPALCLAQSDGLNTDRPDQGDGAATVPKNMFQIENGITAAKQTIINNLLIRYGITNSTELRFLVDAGKENNTEGVKPLIFSIKQKLTNQNKMLPAMSVVGYAAFGSAASNNFSNSETLIDLKLAFENELSQSFSMGYNVGASENFDNLTLTACLSVATTEKMACFAEYFSIINAAHQFHNVNAGFTLGITPSLQLDMAIGRSIFDAENRYFATVGVCWLINKKDGLN